MDKWIRYIRCGLTCLIIVGFLPADLEALQVQNNQKYTYNEISYATILDEYEAFYKTDFDTKISVVVDGLTVEEALREIADITGMKLTYRGDIMERKEVTLVNNKISVSDALDYVLQGTKLDYLFSRDGYLLVYDSEEELLKIQAQEEISGTVTDAQSGETLPGVNVIVKGTTTGTSTDSDGAFELTVESLQDTLIFSFVGYQTREVPINGRTEIDVALRTQAIAGEELVVVGYGTQQRENVTGSIKQISGDDIAEQAAVQTSSALMGKISGTQVIQNSGQPGENQGTIRIRGTGTLGNSNPLVLIDGVEGSIDDVSSSDIESISVLKDAAAASVYGSRAANGVILVTTKRGLEGRVQVGYRGFVGWQEATRQPEFVEGKRFMELENIGATNLGKDPIWSESYIQEWENNYQSDPDNYPNTDWVDAVFSAPGFQQKQNLDISGGNELIRYMGSLTYDEENGNIPNFSFKRYSVRLNTDVTVSEKFDFAVDLNVQRGDRREPAEGLNHITQDAYRVPPVYAAQYSNGGWGPGWNGDNPVGNVHEGGITMNESSKVRARLNASYQPAEAIEINLMYSPEYQAGFYKRMRKQFEIVDPNTGEVVSIHPSKNELSQNFSRNFENNINLTVDYDQSLENHNISLLGGYEFIHFRTDYFDAYRDNFPLQDFEQLNAGSQSNMQNSGSAAEWALQSLFGRVNYDYQNKYLLEANVRYDGSSRFTEDNRWGIFPSFSAGWVISEESFMETAEFISSLKIRGSWGQLGNQQIGNYPFASVVNLGQNYIFGGNTVTGGAQLDLANANISWEETTTLDIGIDASLFNDRFDFTFDYFKRISSDILLQLPVPRIIGLNAPFQNAAEVQNKGWEFEAGYNGNIGTDFSYSIAFNLSDVNNEVTDLKGAGPFIDGNEIIQVGDPINAIYGYESDGLFNSQNEIEEHATQSGQVAPGDIKYVDQDGNGSINSDDRVIIGDPFPSFNYGIDLSASYRNFDVSAFFQGVGSRDVMLQGDAVWALWNAGKIRTWQADDYWTPNNTNASYPRLTQTTSHNNFRATDYWVYDASYLRLRSMQIGYNLPTELTSSLAIRNARIFFLGQNLFTLFDDLPQGVDPNVPNGTSGAYYPVTRLMSVGIDIEF
ncbi:TonB-linked outer membrane protein, SusC/RagA family [Fodinibius roseus]|uniref:TonB-linked outer membrane protein, SusC/RagA family n=1 Tax=Fodinibius roseus TaxID=1194090 RepID=A0A1M5EZ90_9BACT|nr:TonB-dependent receptor [Fodinibius roseus]SHF84281.1 TonB-linked outer membrane protein, SusC/RagA family [Fodinibius roseus]